MSWMSRECLMYIQLMTVSSGYSSIMKVFRGFQIRETFFTLGWINSSYLFSAKWIIMWHFKVRLEETEQNLWEKIMKPILKTLSSANHRGKNVKTWKPLFTKSSYFYRLHYNLLLYKFSDLKPCSLMEGSKKVFDFLRFNKKMYIHQQQRTNGGGGRGVQRIPPRRIPPLANSPDQIPPCWAPPPVNPPPVNFPLEG